MLGAVTFHHEVDFPADHVRRMVQAFIIIIHQAYWPFNCFNNIILLYFIVIAFGFVGEFLVIKI